MARDCISRGCCVGSVRQPKLHRPRHDSGAAGTSTAWLLLVQVLLQAPLLEPQQRLSPAAGRGRALHSDMHRWCSSSRCVQRCRLLRRSRRAGIGGRRACCWSSEGSWRLPCCWRLSRQRATAAASLLPGSAAAKSAATTTAVGAAAAAGSGGEGNKSGLAAWSNARRSGRRSVGDAPPGPVSSSQRVWTGGARKERYGRWTDLLQRSRQPVMHNSTPPTQHMLVGSAFW